MAAIQPCHGQVRHHAGRLAVFLADAGERDALLTATAQLAAPGARVLVLHAGSSAAGHRLVDRAAHWLGSNGLAVQAETLSTGLPTAWALMARVQAYAPDLIVMGSRGFVGLPAVNAASVSHEVLRHATCPVLLVPQGAEAVGDQGPVVSGWDGSRSAGRALRAAAELAAATGTGLQVVQVTARDDPAQRRPPLPSGSGWVVVEADPDGIAATLDRVAAGLGARLVAVGTRRLSVLDAIKLGSVGHELLAVSNRPVLIVP